MKNKIISVMLLIMCFGLSYIALAQEGGGGVRAEAREAKEIGKEVKEKLVSQEKVMKEIGGEVSWLDLKKGYIAILYHQDLSRGEEDEILLPLDIKAVKLEHIKSLEQINKGDTVSIHYEEEIKKYDSNREEAERKAKVVSFVRPAVKKQEPGVLKSEDGSIN